jgi:hypothetical protein
VVAKVNFGVSVPTTTCTPSRQGPEQRSNTAPATATCDTLPDDDAGATTWRCCSPTSCRQTPGNAIPAMMAKAATWAPWLTPDARRKLAERIAARRPIKFKADTRTRAVLHCSRSIEKNENGLRLVVENFLHLPGHCDSGSCSGPCWLCCTTGGAATQFHAPQKSSEGRTKSLL